MSGFVDSPAFAPCGAFEPLSFARYLERTNRTEHPRPAAESREAMATDGEASRQRCVSAAVRDAGVPRLADVSPVSDPQGYTPVRTDPVISIQQLLPTGSIIDVTV